MRFFPAVALAALVIPSVAHAGRSGGDPGGGGRGGGRLGQVNAGLGDARGDRGRAGGTRPVRDHRDDGELYVRETRGDQTVVIAGDGTIVRRFTPASPPATGPARVDVFVGVQKVHASDVAGSAALAIEDRWLRLVGGVTRYQEQQMDGSQQSLTVPTALLGVRLGAQPRTRAFLEGGVASLRTGGVPAGDRSRTGSMVGVHLEHRVGRRPQRRAVLADAHAMFFEDGVRAVAARVGVRVGVVEAAFRVLDVNVGPALFGPEVGLRF